MKTIKRKIISPSEQAHIKTFDLANPEHRIGALQATLDTICQRFERSAKQFFFGLLRKPVNFHFEQQDTLKLREYLASIPKPNSQREFLVEPHDMRGLIAMDGDLLFFMADLFFGGKGTSTRRRSEMSDTELRLVERIFRQLLEQFDDCWRNQTSWYSQMTQQQSLHLNNSMANQPLFQICRFSIQIGEHLGWLEIALPFNGLEFLRTPAAEEANVELDPTLQAKVEERLQQVPLRLQTTLCEKSLTLGDVMDLQVGDVIPVDMPSQLTVRAGNSPLYKARIAERNGNLVLQVDDVLDTQA
ncbi:FliM/FliN family flagellar motor switch protein [Plesiomonas shigelloides]|uniref:Flagellar motor switch protein FliM n=1 Tax=Plesiomonas shigelloides TaxID=703 RepID=A0A8I1W5H2_PLESH|nr:FliM/FliN family flagellar motor switch protein [Plesiomonas shigelloides]MBO1107461.1 FliM/FliN family flagellar motor switch protein [Plesiomonas shigelloides]